MDIKGQASEKNKDFGTELSNVNLDKVVSEATQELEERNWLLPRAYGVLQGIIQYDWQPKPVSAVTCVLYPDLL